MGNKLRNVKGFTLLEVILVLFLCSLLVSSYISISSQTLTYWQEHIEQVRIHENLQYSLHYIEKNIRQLNQQNIEYFPSIKQIKGENSQGETSYLDFSGRKIDNLNTYLYFHEGYKQLRVNRNRENNVLATNINQVEVKEIIPGKLIEITLSSLNNQGKVYTLRSQIRILPRR